VFISTNKKYIICSGCSFTNLRPLNHMKKDLYNVEGLQWPEWLQIMLGDEYIVLNLGNPTNDNNTIKRTIIYWIEYIRKNGGTIDKVFAQWTQPYRNSFLIKDYNGELEIGSHTTNYLPTPSDYKKEFWYLTGGYYETNNSKFIGIDSILKTLHQKLSKEHSYSVVETIIDLSNYLDRERIDYTYFTIKDIFYEPEFHTTDVYNGEIYYNRDMDYFIRNSQYFSVYLDKVPFDKFWFYEEEGLKKGGLYEYSIRKQKELEGYDRLKKVLFSENLDGRFDWYGHPSSILNKKFVNEELIKFI
jgi:hypothetical protein